MNFEKMSLEELKDYAKKNNIKVGNIGREKLIEKLKGFPVVDSTDIVGSLDEDITEEKVTPAVKINTKVEEAKSDLDLINESVDELEEADDDVDNSVVELPPNTPIPVKSITFGTLIYKSPKTNSTVKWDKIGAVNTMSIQEITEMSNTSSQFLTAPYVILNDKDAVKMFRLGKIYENIAKISNLKLLFKKDMKTIEATIDAALEVNMRDVLIAKVRTMCKNKTLTDISIITMLQRKLSFDLIEDITG